LTVTELPDGGLRLAREEVALVLSSDLKATVEKGTLGVTRCIVEAPSFGVVLTDGSEVPFKIDSYEEDDSYKCRIFGAGSHVVVHARGGGLNLDLKILVPAAYPSAMVTSLTVTNPGAGSAAVKELFMNRYRLRAEVGDHASDAAPFWIFTGGSYPQRYDWIQPLEPGFYRENDMGADNRNGGGGTPYSGVWNPAYGIGVASLAPMQLPVRCPISMSEDAVARIGIIEPVDDTIEGGAEVNSSATCVLVHSGDTCKGLAVYSSMMARVGLKFDEPPESAYGSIWCGWGYEDDYTHAEMMETIPAAAELGIKWAVIDAGWYNRNSDWELDPQKYPEGAKTMREFTDGVKTLGMRPKLWWTPFTALYGWGPKGRRGPRGKLYAPEEWLLLQENGEPYDQRWFGVLILCPGYDPVVESGRKFIRRAIEDWGFEGFKVDGGYFNKCPPCYNPAHNHTDPYEVTYAGPEYLRAMMDEALSLVPDAVFELCACGTDFSIYNMTATNQPVSSDARNSWQIRHRGKAYKAMMGPRTAYYGDHVELSDGRSDFASTIGVGGIPGTKFTLAEKRKMVEGTKILTPEKKEKWAKYFAAYERERPAEGTYLNLYDIGYDRPEAHLVEKEGTLYYGFFAPEFDGTVTLRGLADGVSYTITDYIEDKDLGQVKGPDGKLNISFKQSLLLKATAG
jgi:alpha-galactosidase